MRYFRAPRAPGTLFGVTVIVEVADPGPVVGQPVVYLTGLLVLILVYLPVTKATACALETVAHEGGHMVVATLSGRGPKGFHLGPDGGGATVVTGGWGVGRILGLLAGYITPPLVGLAGASLVVAGQSWSVLWAALVLLFGAWMQARDRFTGLIILLAGTGIGWVAVAGPPEAQAVIAVTLVWIMLLGGISALIDLRLGGPGSDSAQLAANTWIPRIVWVAGFWTVAILCLAAGGRALLGF